MTEHDQQGDYSQSDYSQMEARHLFRQRAELVQRLGKVEEELNRRRRQGRHVVKKTEQAWDRSMSIIGMRPKISHHPICLLVSPELGFNVHNFHAFFLEIPPGSSDGAYHMHGEAIKYYLGGRGIEIIGDERYEVEAGDVAFIPAFTWHGTQNPGPEPLRFLAVVQGMGTSVQKNPVFLIREDMREGPEARVGRGLEEELPEGSQ